MKSKLNLGLWLGFLALLLMGCQTPMIELDTLDEISRATLIESAVQWDAKGQELDAQGDEAALSMAQATQLALRNSPELAGALWKVRVAQAEAGQGRMLPNPVLSLTVRFIDGGGNPALEASLAQELLSLLRRGGKITAADDKLRSASAQALTAALNTIAEAQEHYLAAAVVDEELEVLAQRRKLLDRLTETARGRLNAGEGTRLDVTTLEAQQLDLDAQAADFEAERTDQRLVLARVIGRPAGRIDWKLDRSDLPTAPAGTEKDWIAAALSKRPELESKRWDLASLVAEEELAKWGIWEGAEIGVMAQRDPEWQIGPSLTVPLPIFDDGRFHHDKAMAERVVAVHELVATRRQVVEEVRKAYWAAASARSAASRIGDKLIPLHEQRRQQAETAYKAGESDLATLLLAEDSLAASRAKWIELREKAAVSMVKLERAVGGRASAAHAAGAASRPTSAPAPRGESPSSRSSDVPSQSSPATLNPAVEPSGRGNAGVGALGGWLQTGQ